MATQSKQAYLYSYHRPEPLTMPTQIEQREDEQSGESASNIVEYGLFVKSNG
jgi:hypothetical protein